jgi:eukaryotic-like serine/threonine-protein kinase
MSSVDDKPRREQPRFRETALASTLVDESQLAAAAAALTGVIDPATAAPTDWDQALADALVQEKILTAFQARELLAGRKRFRLGQYTVLDEVARGGMGQVFRAEHAMMGREVAVKVLPRAKSTPESEAAFRREMRMLGRLDHENLVRAYDAGYDAMVYYLVTELVPGLDLKRQIQKHGPLDEATAALLIGQAARGLAYAHEQGLVHRDVKPGNLIVMPDGRVKVLDLGLAGSQIEEESSRLGRVVGTMDYIAPEQIRMPDDVGPAADIYALGCTLYFTVTGQVPFPGGTRREKMQRHLAAVPTPVGDLAPQLSADFCRLIEAMMAKDPAERITSAGEVVERLRRWAPAGLPWTSNGAKPERFASDPPPLPDDRSPGSSWLSRLSRQDAPLRPRDDDAPWLLPETNPAFDAVPPAVSSMPTLAELFRSPAVARVIGAGPPAFVVAVIAGLVFGGVMAAVRQIDPSRFDGLVLDASPVGLGGATFLLLFAGQLVAAAGRRHHEQPRDGQK